MLKVPIGVENILLKAVVDSAAQVTIISDVREEEQESALTSAPMLPLPNSTDPSVLVTDADLNEEQGGDTQPPGETRSKSSERPRSPGNYSVDRRSLLTRDTKSPPHMPCSLLVNQVSSP